mgnify:FL=1
MNRLAILLSLLALPAEATDEQVDEAQKTFAAKAHIGDLAVQELKLDLTKPAAEVDAIVTSTLKHSGYMPYAEHVTAMKAVGAEVETLTDDKLLEQARREGKLTPALEPWAKNTIARDRPGFVSWMKSATAVIPLQPGSGGEHARASAALSDSELAVCKQLGISHDDYRKQRA